jgi:hypothetical protein
LGTFHRPRRSNALMMASSNIDGAGLMSLPGGLTDDPIRSDLRRSSSA